MKEQLDYEKKYKEALEVMRQWIAPCHTKKQLDVMKESVFPELRESEDERIKRELIEYLRGDLDDITTDDTDRWIAWIEKQKEQKPAEWSEEDKNMWTHLNGYLNGFSCSEDAIKQMADWFYELPNRFNPQPKQEWSEEEKQKLNRIYVILGQAADTHAFSTTCRLIGDKEAVELQDFIRSIAKPQAQEWSGEDERILKGIIGKIDHDQTYGVSKDEMLSFLKSLRPQPQGTYKLIVHNIYEMLKDKDFFDITPNHRVSLLNDIRVRCKNADEQAEILDVPSM